MSFIFSRPKPSPPPAPAPAPVIAPPVVTTPIAAAAPVGVQTPGGDVATVQQAQEATTETKKRRGGPGRRRGTGTILTGRSKYLGETAGKSLLGV